MIKNTNQLSEAEEKRIFDILTRSRIQMLVSFPFFGILALNLKLEQNYSIKTAGTDGKKFYYNPKFISGLSEGEVNWVVVHEVLHPALKHIWRRNNRNVLKWNKACDYAIHDIMHQFLEVSSYDLKSKLVMPKNVLYDVKFRDMSADEIYELLPDDNNQQSSSSSFSDPNSDSSSGSGQSSDSDSNSNSDYDNGLLGDHSFWDSVDAQEDAQVKSQDWEGKMLNAAESASSKSQGNIPAFLSRIIKNIVKPQKDWKLLLAEFVEPEINDYSFNPPDRRYGDCDFFLPDFNDEEDSVKDLLFWIDTSGSIRDEELSICYSEIVGAINQFSGKLTGHIGFFDSEAYDTEPFESVNDVLKIRPKGGGGTNFSAPFEYTNKNYEVDEVSGIIVLTDGYASWPEESLANGIPVLWIITNKDIKPPWGLYSTLKI